MSFVFYIIMLNNNFSKVNEKGIRHTIFFTDKLTILQSVFVPRHFNLSTIDHKIHVYNLFNRFKILCVILLDNKVFLVLRQ